MTGDIADIVERFAVLTACLFLLFVAWEDFRKFRVRNSSVLILLAIYAVFALARGELRPVLPDLAGGGLLFFLGFAFWLAKLMGAGDAKLFLATGLWVSLPNLAAWSVLLLICSVVLLLLVKIPFPISMRHLAVVGRLEELRKGKNVPYAVPIALATIVMLLPDVFI